jgi:hypothetical protein
VGSLLPDHAAGHEITISLLAHMEIIDVAATTFSTLVDTEKVSSIDILLTDMEGMDVELLPTFPFSQVMPKQIIFEFKHSDGTLRVGPKLANWLLMLDKLGFIVEAYGAENFIATHTAGGTPTLEQLRAQKRGRR